MVYYYVEGKRIDEIFYVCRSLNIQLLTTKKSIHEHALRSGLNSTIINKEPIRFKAEITKIRPGAVLLNNDQLSARGQWIAKKYTSYLIDDLTINTRERYIARKNAGFIGSRFCKVMHRIGGITCLLYDEEIDMHDCSIKTYFRLMRDRLFLGYKAYTALPGWFCNKVIVQNNEIRQLYLENNFPEENILDIGNPYENYYSDLCNNAKNIEPDIDVLFFSQPYYLRGFDNWLDEIGGLVDDCFKNGLKLVIKLHPRDLIEKYEPFKDRSTINYSEGDANNIVNLIQRSRLIVLKYSTVIIQSLLCKKPVAYINYRGVKPYIDSKGDFLESMVLSENNNIKSVFDTISNDDGPVMKHQEKRLEKIARFDNGSISRLSSLLAGDGLLSS